MGSPVASADMVVKQELVNARPELHSLSMGAEVKRRVGGQKTKLDARSFF